MEGIAFEINHDLEDLMIQDPEEGWGRPYMDMSLTFSISIFHKVIYQLGIRQETTKRKQSTRTCD